LAAQRCARPSWQISAAGRATPFPSLVAAAAINTIQSGSRMESFAAPHQGVPGLSLVEHDSVDK
jgi:hypothetical protein